MANNLKLDPFDMVLFGATGDLAMRKLVRALFRRAAAGQIPAGSKIIGVARADLTTEQYLGEARTALEKYLQIGELTPEKWDQFAGLVTYVRADATSAADFEALKKVLEGRDDLVRVIF